MLTLRRAWGLLGARERRRTSGLLVLLIVAAAVETVGVASILPFLDVVADPEPTEDAPAYLTALYAALGEPEGPTFVIAVGAVVLTVLIAGALVRSLATWASVRWVAMRQHALERRLFARMLRLPFDRIAAQGTADLSKTLLTETQQVASGFMKPLVEVVAKGLLAVAILVLLVVVDPVLAAFAALLLGGAYAVVYALAKRRLNLHGQRRVATNRERYAASSEAFDAFREVRLGQLEPRFEDRFQRASFDYARVRAGADALSQVPRYGVEAVAFGGVVALVLFLYVTGGPLQEILPTLGLFAFAGYRLMPALQEVFRKAAKLKFGAPAVHDVWDRFHALDEAAVAEAAAAEAAAHAPASGRGATQPEVRAQSASDGAALAPLLDLRGVSYTYPGADEPALREVTLTIAHGQVVGLCGLTGSGKTTLLDVATGLLHPQRGQVHVEGAPLTVERLGAWRRRIGYVPQEVVLLSGTVARNVLPDDAPLEDPAVQARLDELLAALSLPDAQTNDRLGWATSLDVGVRGGRLSGGQRQRVGLVRALLRDPDLLVLDEATSALDPRTEAQVLDTLADLGAHVASLIVSHRLDALRTADEVHLLEAGTVAATGSYADLRAGARGFDRLTGARATGPAGAPR